MICNDVQKYEYTYLDGEFDGRERTEFEAHIAACEPCRRHVETAARFRDGVRRHLCHESAPSGLQGRICAGLDAAERGQELPRWVMPMAMAAGLSMAVVGWQWSGGAMPFGAPEIGESASFIANSPSAVSAGVAAVAAGKAGKAGKAAPTPPAVAPAAMAPAVAAAMRPATLVATGRRFAGLVRGSDPKRTAQRGDVAPNPHLNQVALAKRGAQEGPAMRVTRSLRNNVEYCESERRHAAGLRQVDHIAGTEVIGGGVGDDFLAGDSYSAIRTRANLQALVSLHMQPVPPEVAGAARVQDWLRRVAPGHSSLPIAEGAGVRLLGARLGHLGSRRVVSFRYTAFDKPVTVVRYLPVMGHGLRDDRPEPAGQEPQRSGAVRDLAAGYGLVHMVKDGEIMSIVSDLEYSALRGIIEPPSFL